MTKLDSNPDGTADVAPGVSADAVRAQLDRLLASESFGKSERMKGFLRFVVSETLAGASDRLKEYPIAIEVFGRDESFDPKTSAIVRVEAGRMRRRLREYFSGPGQNDPVHIALPVGSYVPEFTVGGSTRAQRDAVLATAQGDARRPRPRPALLVVAVLAVSAFVGIGLWRNAVSPPPSNFVPDGQSANLDDSVLTMPTGRTIAVLPFTNLSGDSEQEYFSDGIAEEIITELARYKNLRVLARNSTFRYNAETIDVRQVGREQGARYVILGSVRRAGDTVRVSAQLLDSKDGKHLWADTYERALTPDNIFGIQDDITQHVSATVAGSFGVVVMAGASEAMHRSAENLSAYECVLRAKWYDAESLAREDHLKVRGCLEQAVQTDPGYADAWAWLSFIYNNEYTFGYNRRPNPLERALDAALTAVKLSPHSGDAQRQLSFVLYFLRDSRFFEAANRALALTPHDPSVLAEIGYMLGWAGDWDRGAALTRKAIALSVTPPAWYYNYLTLYHYHRSEYEEALNWAAKSELPTFFWPYVNRAAVYGQLGRDPEARSDLEKLAALYPNFAQHARSEYSKFFWEEDAIDHVIEGLRKAGLDIPDESVASK